MLRRLQQLVGLLMVLLGTLLFGTTAFATESLLSPNYRFDESSIGTGGLDQSSSANYKAVGGTGDVSVGSSSSASFQDEAGSRTTDDPVLTFTFNNANVGFGSFTPTSGSTSTATFSIKNYTSYGYLVQIYGDSVKNGSHEIPAMGANAASQPGVEQFGINLVANTDPSNVGANVDNGNFGFGAIATNYDTPNQYRYVSGETIAQAPKSSGETTYTITYLVNVGNLTPGGRYSGNQTIIVIGTY